MEGGERVSDSHVLSGRSDTEGGPVITADELADSRFLSRNGDVAPLERTLRTHIDARAEIGDDDDLTNELTVFADGTVKVSTPERGGFDSRPADFRSPFASIDTNDYRRQYKALCQDDVLGNQFPERGPPSDPCDPFALGKDIVLGLDADDLLDQMAFKLERSDIEVSWAAPRDLYNVRLVTEDGDPVRLSPSDSPGDCCNGCESGFICSATGFTCTPSGDGGMTGGPVCEFESDRSCDTLHDCRVASGEVAGAHAPCTDGSCDFTGELVRFDRDPDPDAPVLLLHMPFDVHTDLIDLYATWLLAGVDVTHTNVDYRLQPVACPGGCATADGVRALGYRGPSPAGDLRLSTTALDVHARATQSSVIRFYPSVLCALVPSCVVAIQLGLSARVQRSLDRAARRSAEALQQMLRIPTLQIGTGQIPRETYRDRCIDAVGETICDTLADSAGGDPWQVLSDNVALDLGIALVQVNDDTGSPSGPAVPVGAPGGVWTDTTTQALARGARVVSITADTRGIAGACTGGTCGGPAPDPRCPVCNLCAMLTPPAGAPPAICRFGPAQTITDPSGLFTIPPSPEIARTLDAAPNLAAEIRGVFTRPLEDLRASLPPAPAGVMACGGGGPSPVRYTDTLYCDPSGPSGFLCPAEPGAVFRFEVDRDRDGVFFPNDNCEDDCNPAQADADRDGLGDACDTCPCMMSTIDHDFDGDMLADPCDPDIDDDGCNNDWLVPPIAGCGLPAHPPLAPGTVFDTNNRGCELARGDGTPCRPGPVIPGTCADTDGDGIFNDCDPDDDDDLVADSLDNCRLVPNPGQLDENEDGIGDACDCLCPGAGTPACSPGGPGGGGGGPGGGPSAFIDALTHVNALLPLRGCWTDGPLCPSFLALDCPTFQGRCASTGTTLYAFGPRGDVTAATALEDVPVGLAGSAAVLPDLDGDGLGEIALGATAGAPCTIDGQCVDRGAVTIVGSRAGQGQLSLAAPRAGEDFGASTAATGSLLFVGAPDALDVTGRRTGAVYRIHLAPDGPIFEEAFYGTSDGERFGETLVLVEDIDGDGYADGLLVGAPEADVHGKRHAGRIDAMTLTGERLLALDGPFAGGHMGRHLTAVLPDAFQGPASTDFGVAAGIPEAFGGRGAVAFFTWRGHRRWVVPGSSRDGRFGTSLSRAADFDGDGVSEIAVGAPGQGDGAGALVLLGPRGRVAARVEGLPGNELGEHVVAPGDLDGDGLLDLMASRPGVGLTTVYSGMGGEAQGPHDRPF